jgi:hypothetical protein
LLLIDVKYSLGKTLISNNLNIWDIVKSTISDENYCKAEKKFSETHVQMPFLFMETQL